MTQSILEGLGGETSDVRRVGATRGALNRMAGEVVQHGDDVSVFALQALIALPAAYALAKLRFWGRDLVFALVLFCILIPAQAIAVPVFLLFHHAGILDTYAALIVPFTISAFVDRRRLFSNSSFV